MIDIIIDLLYVFIDSLIEINHSKPILISSLIILVGTFCFILLTIGKYDLASIIMSLIVALLVALSFCLIAGIIYKIIHK